MDNLFTIEETNLLCIFQSDSKEKVIEEIRKSMKHIDDDELVELSVSKLSFSVLGLLSCSLLFALCL